MAVTKETKYYCANNLVGMMIDTIQMFHPDISRNEFISEFTKSDTCRLLYDLKTRLWAEGPNYIIGLYEEEKGITLLPDYI